MDGKPVFLLMTLALFCVVFWDYFPSVIAAYREREETDTRIGMVRLFNDCNRSLPKRTLRNPAISILSPGCEPQDTSVRDLRGGSGARNLATSPATSELLRHLSYV